MQEDKEFIKLQSDLIVELRKQISQMAREAEHMRTSFHINNNAQVAELNNKIFFYTDKIHAQEEKIVRLLEEIDEKDEEIKSLQEELENKLVIIAESHQARVEANAELRKYEHAMYAIKQIIDSNS